MKKMKLIAPILGLSATTLSVVPSIACHKVNPKNLVDVMVVETDGYVRLEKTKAQKGKEFKAHVNYVSAFALDKVTVFNGTTQLIEGQHFSFDYVTRLLIIRDGVISDTINIKLEFLYVTFDVARYRTWGHDAFMYSAEGISVSNIEKPFDLYMTLDYSNWPTGYPFPTSFFVGTEDTVTQEYAHIVSCSCIYAEGIGSGKTESDIEIVVESDTIKMTLKNGAALSIESVIQLEIVCTFPNRLTNYRFTSFHDPRF